MELWIWWVVLGISSSILAALVGYWVWSILDWLWFKPKKLEKYLRQQGFAGNSYQIFHGDMKEREAMRIEANSKPMKNKKCHDIAPRIIPSIHHTVMKYGKKSFMWIGPHPRLHILDTNQLKTVLSMENDVRTQDSNPYSKYVIDGLVTYDGPKWVKHRKILNPAFHLENLKEMVPGFLECCNEMVGKWEKMVIEKGGSCELDVWPYLQNMAADVISRTAFGSCFEDGKIIFKHLKELMTLVYSEAGSTTYIPGWRFLPTKLNNRMKHIEKEIKGLLSGIINKRQWAMKNGETTPKNDLLGILLESNSNEIRQHGHGNYSNKAVGMSMDDVLKECKLFYVAGQETTATLLVWTMVLLSSHPEWQDRARSEVLQVFGNNPPNFDGISQLKTVSMILNEALRLYPPAAFTARRFSKEVRIGTSRVPAGVDIAFPIALIHHDCEIWGEDVNEFKPERFSEGVSKASKNKKTLSFFPFGWGPRICIGQNFALIEAKLALVSILKCFSFHLSPSYTHAPTSILTTRPQHGAHLIIHKL